MSTNLYDPDAELERAVWAAMDLTPRGIREKLDLNKPIYARTSAYGHFGREPDAEACCDPRRWREAIELRAVLTAMR